LLSRAALAAGDIERACAASKAAVEYGPDDVEALEADAKCELALGRLPRALARIRAARALEPDNRRLAAAERRLRQALPEADLAAPTQEAP
jgi:Flp pilus assembly protein TadD